MNFFKRLFWTLCLTPDWYFIRQAHDNVLRPAYWNGVVWEDRIEVIHDWRVCNVGGRVPNPGDASCV